MHRVECFLNQLCNRGLATKVLKRRGALRREVPFLSHDLEMRSGDCFESGIDKVVDAVKVGVGCVPRSVSFQVSASGMPLTRQQVLR